MTVPLRIGKPTGRRRHPADQRGAALLLALVILTLVATLASGMVWQHARAIQVEGSERARLQSAWVLNGALDWAVLILREDLREDIRKASPNQERTDHLGEPWGVPLAESRLSTFLAADRSGTTVDGDDGPDAFLSGSIVDLQARWNLRNLIVNGAIDDAQGKVLQRLCDAAGVPATTASQLATAFLNASAGTAGASMLPSSMADLWWLGVEPAVVAALKPFMTLLPNPTPLNVNTASAEVIAAAMPAMTLGDAQGLVQARQSMPFKTFAAFVGALSPAQKVGMTAALVNVSTSYFEVRGRLRLDDHVLEVVSVIHRVSPNQIDVVRRERLSLSDVATR